MVTDPRRWPLLASCSLEQAQATKIEWLVDEPPVRCSCCGQLKKVGRRAEYNFTQIFREIVRHDETREDALRRLLDSVETALRSGLREFGFVGAYTTMGGVVELLGRWPHKTDQLILKELRPLRFVPYRESGVLGEWLWEVSLMAVRRGA
jgi:hypothetical protein